MFRFRHIAALALSTFFLYFSLHCVAWVLPLQASQSASEMGGQWLVASDQMPVYAFTDEKPLSGGSLRVHETSGKTPVQLPVWFAALQNRDELQIPQFARYVKQRAHIVLRLSSYSIAFPFHEFW
jgi:hypothetical protein